MDRRSTGIILVAIAAIGLLTFPFLASNNPAGYGCGVFCGLNGTVEVRPRASNTPVSFDQAVSEFRNYVTATGNKDLAVREVMEFENNYYAIVYEKSTDMGAFELLIDKTFTERPWGMGSMMGTPSIVHPEPGPGMMWNTRYGMMTGMGDQRGNVSVEPGASANMPISADQAKSYATNYLKERISGASLQDPDQFYGYYTIHILKDGKITGMLSVNGFNGDVWYHSWHGIFIQAKDFA